MIDFEKGKGLVPVIIQDYITWQVLMTGFMDREAYDKTIKEGKVTFFSRSKNRLWTKGETSGNFLHVKEITSDCDNDALLIKVDPYGPVCHKGSKSCFDAETARGFIYKLEQIIDQRVENNVRDSYTYSLFSKGINKMAQKVGEEAVELVIEAMSDSRDHFINEAADLLYHLLILLKSKGTTFEEVEEVLKSRHKIRN